MFERESELELELTAYRREFAQPQAGWNRMTDFTTSKYPVGTLTGYGNRPYFAIFTNSNRHTRSAGRGRVHAWSSPTHSAYSTGPLHGRLGQGHPTGSLTQMNCAARRTTPWPVPSGETTMVKTACGSDMPHAIIAATPSQFSARQVPQRPQAVAVKLPRSPVAARNSQLVLRRAHGNRVEVGDCAQRSTLGCYSAPFFSALFISP